MKWDKKTTELFKELISRPRFQKEVLLVRGFLGIPAKPNIQDPSEELWTDALEGSYYLIPLFKLPMNYHGLLVEYILDDTALSRPWSGRPPSEIHRAGISRLQDSWSVEIRPGAVKSDVIKLIKDWWPYIEKGFKNGYPEKYMRGIRVKKYRDRDAILRQLRAKGIFKSDGTIAPEPTAKLLRSHGVEVGPRFTDYKKELENILGFKLPTVDAIRKAIYGGKSKK